jgi:hypothetical protein
MKPLINGQTISMDAHVAGKTPNYKDLHIHKKVNGHNKSVEIRISVDINKSIRVEGRDDKIRNEIKQTIKRKQNEQLVRDFANEVINEISKYDEIKRMDKQAQKKILIDYAKRLAEYFKISDFRDVMTAEVDNKIHFLLTSHEESNKLYYIKQDLIREYIKIGDDLEQIFHGNENYHYTNLFDNE